jgi:hypothetical protein
MNINRDLDGYSKTYFEQPYEEFQVLFRKKKIIEFLELYQPKKILEVGCGMESILLDYNFCEKITVVEPSNMFYDKLQKDVSLSSFKFSISTHKCLFEEFECEENFDFIIISSLLHEIIDLKSFFNKLIQISSTDTIIHINVPNSESFHRLLALECGMISGTNQLSDFNKSFQQQRVFNLNQLSKLCEDYGLDILERGSFSFKPFTHSQMSKIVSSNSVDTSVISNIYRLDKYLNGLGSEIFVNVRKK